MQSEFKLQLQAIFKLLICVVFASLYAFGGMDNKWLRRFLAPAILCVSMFIFSKDKKSLLQYPLMCATLCLGYGASSLWLKILKRFIFGFANGSSSIAYGLFKKQWLIAGLQIVSVTAFYIVLGVWNPLPSARAEETVLGFMLAFLPLMSIKEE